MLIEKDGNMLMKGPLVKQTRQGIKTETRRIVAGDLKIVDGLFVWNGKGCEYGDMIERCPYGKPGGLIWVRENMGSDGDDWWFPDEGGDSFDFPMDDKGVDYRADVLAWMEKQRASNRVRVPSIHMPRWASRVTLEILKIKVERVQNMTDADAEAEGIAAYFPTIDASPRYKFALLWDAINAERAPWHTNPWVWVVQYKAHLMNIDVFKKQRAAA